MMLFIHDEAEKKALVYMTRAERRRLKADAKKRGLSVQGLSAQEIMQADMDAYVVKWRLRQK